MSTANIYKPTLLLSRANVANTFSDQATILPFNKPVLVVSGPFSQDDLDKYTWCLKSPQIGSWIRSDGMSTSSAIAGAITSADERLDIPQIRIGPGLSQDLHATYESRYVLIIQGRSGAHKVKVMIANTLEQAATIMMHEALNGYSTVFSTSYKGPNLPELPFRAKLKATDSRFGNETLEGEYTSIAFVCKLPGEQLYGY